jgi:hypothetical protein
MRMLLCTTRSTWCGRLSEPSFTNCLQVRRIWLLNFRNWPSQIGKASTLGWACPLLERNGRGHSPVSSFRSQKADQASSMDQAWPPMVKLKEGWRFPDISISFATCGPRGLQLTEQANTGFPRLYRRLLRPLTLSKEHKDEAEDSQGCPILICTSFWVRRCTFQPCKLRAQFVTITDVT